MRHACLRAPCVAWPLLLPSLKVLNYVFAFAYDILKEKSQFKMMSVIVGQFKFPLTISPSFAFYQTTILVLFVVLS